MAQTGAGSREPMLPVGPLEAEAAPEAELMAQTGGKSRSGSRGSLSRSGSPTTQGVMAELIAQTGGGTRSASLGSPGRSGSPTGGGSLGSPGRSGSPELMAQTGGGSRSGSRGSPGRSGSLGSRTSVRTPTRLDPRNERMQTIPSLSCPIPASRHSRHSDDSGQCRQCRFCLEEVFQNSADDVPTLSPDRLIAPCQCAGTQRWVHRKCLDHWRSEDINPQAFTHCGVCGFCFRLVLADPEKVAEEQRALKRRRRRFVGRTVSHFFFGFIVVQLLLASLAVIIRVIDVNEKLVDVFSFLPGQADTSHDDRSYHYSLMNHKNVYYTSAFLVAFILLGIAAVIYNCTLGDEGSAEPQSGCGRCARNLLLCNGDGCDCDPGFAGGETGYCCCDGLCCRDCMSGSCSGEGDSCGCLLPLFLAIVVALAFAIVFIGFGIAAMAFTAWVQRSLTRYLQLRELRSLTEEYLVEDLFHIPNDASQVSVSFVPSSRGGPPSFQVSNPTRLSIASFPPSTGMPSLATLAGDTSRTSSMPSLATGGESIFERQRCEETPPKVNWDMMSDEARQIYLDDIAAGETISFAPVTERNVSEMLQQDLASVFGRVSANVSKRGSSRGASGQSRLWSRSRNGSGTSASVSLRSRNGSVASVGITRGRSAAARAASAGDAV